MVYRIKTLAISDWIMEGRLTKSHLAIARAVVHLGDTHSFPVRVINSSPDPVSQDILSPEYDIRPDSINYPGR